MTDTLNTWITEAWRFVCINIMPHSYKTKSKKLKIHKIGVNLLNTQTS